MSHLPIDRSWTIPAKNLKLSFVRSSGPGGQNVNKLATKAELRLNLEGCDAISPAQKARLIRRYPAHVTQAGEFVLASDRHRSQRLNEADVRTRLAEILRSIQRPPKPRVATKISLAQKRRRLEQKRRRGVQKRQRSQSAFEQD